MITSILVIGRHEEIVQTLLRLIRNNPQWTAQAALDDKTAIDLFDKFSFDIVLLSGGIEEESEQELRRYFTNRNNQAIIIQHFGGGSGLLSNEILQALNEKAKGGHHS